MGNLKSGAIFFADLGSKTRPGMVVQKNNGNYFSTRTIVVPLTSKIKNTLPTHVIVCWGSIRSSAVQCEEITHVEVNDDWQAVETLPPEIMRHVDEALKIAIGLE